MTLTSFNLHKTSAMLKMPLGKCLRTKVAVSLQLRALMGRYEAKILLLLEMTPIRLKTKNIKGHVPAYKRYEAYSLLG